MDIKHVQVQFINTDPHYNPKYYSYLTDLDLVVDDLVVVEAKDSYGLAWVKEISSGISQAGGLKWVVTKIDTARLADAKQHWQQILELRTAIADRRAKLEESAIWIILAEKDEAMRELLDKLRNLDKSIALP